MTAYKLVRYGVEYWSNRAAGMDDKTSDPVVIGIHGNERNASGLVDTLVKAAAGKQVLIICPRFRTDSDPAAIGLEVWSSSGWKEGGLSHAGWSSFTIVERFLDALKGRPTKIVGHSAGGQFLQRWAFVSAYPNTKIIVANPGSYMYHNETWSYKYGLRNLPSQMTTRITSNQRFTLLLGALDTNPNDSDLDTSKTAMLQGPNRYQRGVTYSMVHKAPYTVVPGVGHTASGMFTSTQGKTAIFG